MRLEALEVIPYALPFREPYVTARGELRERELILIWIRGEGLEGLGETTALSLRGGIGLEASASAHAVAAVDIALHDLVGRAKGEPVWKLLGASEATPVICNATLPAANPAATRMLLEAWRSEGFRTYKLKVGLPGDVTQVATVRQTLGPEAAIRVDANGAWSVRDATERLRALAKHEIELVEQPVGTFEQMVEVRREIPMRIAADESLVSPFDARRARELGACEVAAVKLAKVGGIGSALEVAEV